MKEKTVIPLAENLFSTFTKDLCIMRFKIISILFLSSAAFELVAFSQGTWVQKANISPTGRWAAGGFSVGNFGYITLGQDQSNAFVNDLWQYDPVSNTWTQKANFPGITRYSFVSMTIGSKGYIGCGQSSSSTFLNDFWEYDPSLNTWSQKTNFPGTARYGAFGLGIGNCGYMGLGWNISSYFNDFWEYNPTLNTWTQKVNYPGSGRVECGGFALGNLGYVGSGSSPCSTAYNDFWEFNPAANSWTAKANIPGTSKQNPIGFALCSHGYLGWGDHCGTPYNVDMYEYNPTTNSWAPMANLPTSGRDNPIWFSIGNKGYAGTGLNGSKLNDFWEFTPPGGSNPIATISSTNTSICAGQSTTLTAGGGTNYSWNNGATSATISVSPSSNTTYTVIVNSGCGSDTAKTTIYVNNPPIAIATDATVCAGQMTSLAANGGGTYSWSNGSTLNPISVAPSSTSTYSVIVSNGSCSDTASATVTVLPAPIVAVSGSTTLAQGQTITLSASGGGSYLWSNGSTDSSITVIPTATSFYCVTVTNSNNCKDSSCITISIEPVYCGDIFLPNAFSPNGDQENDILKADINNTSCIKTFSLSIYNRWGELVFETTDVLKGWNGIYKEKPENTAVFAYYLQAEFFSGKLVEKKGNISLVR